MYTNNIRPVIFYNCKYINEIFYTHRSLLKGVSALFTGDCIPHKKTLVNTNLPENYICGTYVGHFGSEVQDLISSK